MRMTLRTVKRHFTKGHLSHCERWPFSVQKTAFCNAKGRLLESYMNIFTYHKTKKWKVRYYE